MFFPHWRRLKEYGGITLGLEETVFCKIMMFVVIARAGIRWRKILVKELMWGVKDIMQSLVWAGQRLLDRVGWHKANVRDWLSGKS